MVMFASSNTLLDWAAVKAFIDGSTDKRYVYSETDTSSGSTVRVQTLIQYDTGTTAYIASRTLMSDNIASGVSAGTKLIPNGIGISTVSPEAAYTAAKSVDMPEK